MPVKGIARVGQDPFDAQLLPLDTEDNAVDAAAHAKEHDAVPIMDEALSIPIAMRWGRRPKPCCPGTERWIVDLRRQLQGADRDLALGLTDLVGDSRSPISLVHPKADLKRRQAWATTLVPSSSSADDLVRIHVRWATQSSQLAVSL